MKKILSIVLCILMLLPVVALVGCSAEPLQFGMGVVASYDSVANADGDTNGSGEANTTAVAVLLDADGKIVKIDLDTAQLTANWTSEGKIVATEDLRTKYEKGTDYGMAAYGHKHDGTDGEVLEWYAQADAFMETVVGKTLDEVKALMADDGYATGELATAGCTIGVSDFIAALEKAVAGATESAATADDTLNIAMIATAAHENHDATADAEGSDELDTTIVAAVVDADGKVVVAKTDATQGKFTFDAKGVATVDATAEIKSKLEQGDAYNMAAYGADLNGDGKVLEWYDQAAAFNATLVGKTADEIGGLVVEGYGSEDLQTAGCTIAVSDMVAAAVKAATVA